MRRDQPDELFRGRAPGLVQLFDIDLTQVVTGGSKGIAAGAKVLDLVQGNVACTLVNAGDAFLRADPNGLVLTNGTGLVMDSTGAVASTDDWNPANLGPVLVFNFSDLVPAALWSSTELGLRQMYSAVEIIAVFDASAANANTELCSVALAESSSWLDGASARVGYAGGAAAAGGASQTATYAAVGGTLAQGGLPSLPTCCRIMADIAGSRLWYGVASGLVPPNTWYSRDNYENISSLVNTPGNTSGALRHTQVFGLGLADVSATGFSCTFKRIIGRARRHAHPYTVTIAA